jgi:hypothetical protein
MQHRYAQIDENKICVGDSYLHSEVTYPHMIPIAIDAPSPLGKQWNGVEFIDLA